MLFHSQNREVLLSHKVARAIDASYTPTVTLLASDGTMIAASQNATKGPRTTLDVSATAGQTTIPLTDTTDIEVGDSYLLTNAVGQSEYIIVDSITAGASVESRAELRHSYEAGDTIVSLKVSVMVSAAETATTRANARTQ